MKPSLMHRITIASTHWRQSSGLIERIGSRWRWKLLTSTLAIMGVITLLTLSLCGCTDSNSAGWATSTSTICESCHGTGEVAYVAEEKVVTEEEQCVLSVEEMRDRHKELLSDWKKSEIYDGDSIYVASDLQEYNMSLTGTCLDCQSP